MISILLVDNHDSFTYNLLETLRQTHLCTIDVFCLEQMNDIELAKYQGVILSPGPGLPSEKKGLNTLISAVVNASIPLLGVCLGHQAIAQYFGAELLQLKQIIHGEASIICVFGDSNFYHKIKKNLQVGRYHS